MSQNLRRSARGAAVSAPQAAERARASARAAGSIARAGAPGSRRRDPRGGWTRPSHCSGPLHAQRKTPTRRRDDRALGQRHAARGRKVVKLNEQETITPPKSNKERDIPPCARIRIGAPGAGRARSAGPSDYCWPAPRTIGSLPARELGDGHALVVVEVAVLEGL